VGAGTARLSVLDPDLGRAQALIAQLQATTNSSLQLRAGTPQQAAQWVPQATGIVNASPIGMLSHPGVPLDPAVLQPHHWVADIVHLPARNEWSGPGDAGGRAVMPCQAMAVEQAADTC